MPIKDPEKRKAYYRTYVTRRYKDDTEFRLKHRERTLKNEVKYLEGKRKILLEFRSLGCKFCGEKEFCCLDAHHIDPTQKEFALSQALYQNKYGLKRFQLEVNKCVCLCRNCHAKLHANIIQL